MIVHVILEKLQISSKERTEYRTFPQKRCVTGVMSKVANKFEYTKVTTLNEKFCLNDLLQSTGRRIYRYKHTEIKLYILHRELNINNNTFVHTTEIHLRMHIYVPISM